MEYFQIRNFEKFQTPRNPARPHPPWIKLWQSLLDAHEFQQLTDMQRWWLIALFLLADRLGNKIPKDGPYLVRNLVLNRRCSVQTLVRVLSHWIEPYQQVTAEKLPLEVEKIRGRGTTSQPEQRGLVMQEPEKPKKPRKQANHVTQIVDYFNARYRQFSHGQPYVGPGVVADRTQVKRLFTSNPRLNPLYVREMVEAFFMALENPDEHRTGNDNGWGAIVPSVTSFCKHIPKIQKRFTMDEPPEVGNG